MKILHIIVGLDVGGAELALHRLISASSDEHSVISLTNVGVVGAMLQSSGVQVAAMSMKSLIDAPRIMLKLAAEIRKAQPDVVQTWMYHANLLGGLAARIAGTKNILWGIRTTDVKAGKSRATTWVNWLCAKLSSVVPRAIVCAAHASLKTHVDDGYEITRMLVIPNGFDLVELSELQSERASLRAKLGFGPDNVVIGSVGRFNPVKDHPTFVRAAGMLAKGNHNVRFLMVGREVEQSNSALKDWINATGYATHFVLLGERSDVSSCLAVMDIFCLHSKNEGFPNVVAEAMGTGLPCVVTDVGDAKALIQDAGVCVPRQDPEALASAIENLLQLSTDERLSLGKRGRQRISSEFTMAKVRERYESLYRHITVGTLKNFNSVETNV